MLGIVNYFKNINMAMAGKVMIVTMEAMKASVVLVAGVTMVTVEIELVVGTSAM